MKKQELINALSELSIEAADQILGYHDEALTEEAIKKTIALLPRFLRHPLGPVTPGYIAYLLLKANDREEEYFSRYYNGPSMENKQENQTASEAAPDDEETPIVLPSQEDVDTAYSETLYTLAKALAKAYAIPDGTARNIDLHAILHARTEFSNAIDELYSRAREKETNPQAINPDPLAYKWLYSARAVLGLAVTAYSAANFRIADALPSVQNMVELEQAKRTRNAMSSVMTDLNYIQSIKP